MRLAFVCISGTLEVPVGSVTAAIRCAGAARTGLNSPALLFRFRIIGRIMLRHMGSQMKIISFGIVINVSRFPNNWVFN